MTIENEIADDACNETSVKYEKVIKTLENTILKLQERIANQDIAIEQLTKRLNESSSSSKNSAVRPSSSSGKTIKKLEVNVHTLFEITYHQQTCINNKVVESKDLIDTK